MSAPLNTGLAASLARMLGGTGNAGTAPVVAAWRVALSTEPEAPQQQRAVDPTQGAPGKPFRDNPLEDLLRKVVGY